MKVLVATVQTQGQRESDFNYCVEGELLWIQEPCDRDAMRLPSSCGCGRAFSGLASHRATTTATVAELPISVEEYVTAIESSLREQGWPTEWASDIAFDQTALAESWDVGSVIERDLDVLGVRLVR